MRCLQSAAEWKGRGRSTSDRHWTKRENDTKIQVLALARTSSSKEVPSFADCVFGGTTLTVKGLFGCELVVSTWTAFFKLPEGGFRTSGKIASEDECKRYIGAFKDGIPTACRQLAMPVTCNVACVAPVPAPPPAATLWSLTRSPTQQALTPNPATFRSAASSIRR